MVVVCAMSGCTSSSKYDRNRSFFHFPKDEARCKEWVKASGRSELNLKSAQVLNRSYHVCDLHFELKDRLIKKLKTNAVPNPCRMKLHKVSEYESRCKLTQTELEDGEDDYLNEDPGTSSVTVKTERQSPTEEWSTESVIETKESVFATAPERPTVGKSADDKASVLSSLPLKNYDLPPELLSLINIQNRLLKRVLDRRYGIEFYIFALNIYFMNQQAYSFLRNTLRLPSVKALRHIKLGIGSNINPDVERCLKNKVLSLKDSARCCTVSVTKIPLKKNLYYQIRMDKIVGFQDVDGRQTMEAASEAFVLMARGVLNDWKQPLAYCFLSEDSDEFSTWLEEMMSKFLNVGYEIVALVSNQGPDYMNFANKHNVSFEKPYFLVGGKKIYYIFDVPDLVISLRNNLMQHDFKFLDADETEVTAKWEHIRTLYQQDSERMYRLAPLLTESHLNPTNSEKRKVKYATEVFSNTVAWALNASVEFEILEIECLDTAKLINLVNDIFDILNSSAVKDPDKNKNASGPHPIHVIRFMNFLSQVTICNADDSAEQCLNGFKITLQSILALSNEFGEKGFQLLVHTLNLNSLRSFTGSLVKQMGNRRKPTAIQVSRTFRKCFMTALLKGSSNCPVDLSDLVDKIDMKTLRKPKVTTLPIVLSVGPHDYRFKLPKHNAFTAVCAYVLKRCYEIHKCEVMNRYVHSNIKVMESVAVIKPPKTFVKYMKQLYKCFNDSLNTKASNYIGNQILTAMKDISFSDACMCFPVNYSKRLFVRFRIFQIIRYNNKMLKKYPYRFRDYSFLD